MPAWILAAAIALFVGRAFVPGVAIAEYGYGAVFVVLWLLLLGGWWVACAKGACRPLRMETIDWAVLLFFLVYAASGVMAGLQVSPRPAANVTWHWFSVGITYFLFRQLPIHGPTRRAIVAAMVSLAAAMAAIGLEQVFVSLPAARETFERFQDDLHQLYANTGQWLPEGSTERQQFEARLESAEPTATFALTNSLAGLLAPIGVIMLGILAAEWRHRKANEKRSVLPLSLVAPVPLLLGCLIFTHSRSGLLALASGGLTAVLISARRPALWVLAMAALAATGGLTLYLAAPSMIDAAARSLAFRFEYWQATLAMIGDYPLFGCGPGLFQDTYTAYKLPAAGEEIADPHNFLFEIWSTGGSLAALIFLAALGLILWRVAPRRSSVPAAAQQADEENLKRIKFIYAGSVAGVLLGAVAAWLDWIVLPFLHLAMALAVQGLTLVLLHRWVIAGRLPSFLPALAAGTLLLHLCVSGGIGEPFLASLFWLLIVLELADAPAAHTSAESHQSNLTAVPSRPASALVAAAPLVIVGCLLLGAYITLYRPVVGATASLARADAAALAGNQRLHLQAVQDARHTDPWSIEAARRLAGIRFSRWQQRMTPESRQAWVAADEAVRRLAPRRHSVWRESAARYAAVYRRSKSENAIEHAIDLARQAVRRYPTHADHHLYLAELLVQAGEPAAAKRAVLTAIALDQAQQAAGHVEKLLPPVRRDVLENLSQKLGVSEVTELRR